MINKKLMGSMGSTWNCRGDTFISSLDLVRVLFLALVSFHFFKKKKKSFISLQEYHIAKKIRNRGLQWREQWERHDMGEVQREKSGSCWFYEYRRVARLIQDSKKKKKKDLFVLWKIFCLVLWWSVILVWSRMACSKKYSSWLVITLLECFESRTSEGLRSCFKVFIHKGCVTLGYITHSMRFRGQHTQR